MIQVQPRDVVQVLNGVGAIQNPRSTALSVLGLSPEEQQAGVPAWAWATLALCIGAYLGAKYGGKLRNL